MTETEVKKKIASSTQDALSVVTSDRFVLNYFYIGFGQSLFCVVCFSIMKGFDDTVIVERSRYAWKYGCSRAICGTPQFLVNGVMKPDGGDYNAKQWETFIDGLINGTVY